MNTEDLDKLADKIHTLLAQERKNFWVEPEQHYNDHQSLHEMVLEWKAIKGMFWKTFIGFGIVGTIFLAGVGAVFKK